VGLRVPRRNTDGEELGPDAGRAAARAAVEATGFTDCGAKSLGRSKIADPVK
jgi:hypothetical protein